MNFWPPSPRGATSSYSYYSFLFVRISLCYVKSWQKVCFFWTGLCIVYYSFLFLRISLWYVKFTSKELWKHLVEFISDFYYYILNESIFPLLGLRLVRSLLLCHNTPDFAQSSRDTVFDSGIVGYIHHVMVSCTFKVHKATLIIFYVWRILQYTLQKFWRYNKV